MHLLFFSPGLKIHLQPYCFYHQFWCYFQQNKRKPAVSGVVWAGPQRIPTGFRRHPGRSSNQIPVSFCCALTKRPTCTWYMEVSWVIGVPPVIILILVGFDLMNPPAIGVAPWLWKSPYDSLSHSVRCHDQVWYPILIHQDFPCQRWYLLICGVFSPRIFWYPKWLVWNGTSELNMEDLGVPPLMETTRSFHSHVATRLARKGWLISWKLDEIGTI